MPLITTSSLTLRAFVEPDAPTIFSLSQEEGMREWLPDQVYRNEAHALHVLRYLIAKYNDPGNPALAPCVLGVCLADSGELIGHVGLSPLRGEEQVEIGCAIETQQQRRGYGAQAVRAMSEWGLRQFALPCIMGIVHGDNLASCRMVERAGYVLVEATPGSLHGRPGEVRRYKFEE